MKKKIIWLSLSFLLVAAMLLASCSTSSTTTAITTASTTTPSKTTTTTSTAPLTTTTATTTTTGNWWNNLGKPQYGGQIVIRMAQNPTNFDPYNTGSLPTFLVLWMEELHMDDWTENPAIYPFMANWTPPDLTKGLVAESWEMTDPSTYVVHLHKGIHWQDIPPANGREFTADDVLFNYGRIYGVAGGGFAKPSPYQATAPIAISVGSISAPDKYTVVFNWKMANPEYIMESMQPVGQWNCFACPEAIKQWGDVNDWHHAIGTGAFILTDFVSNSSATLVKNPSYWGYDERYPQNKLPYVDGIKILIIPEAATALAALRTGKIDAMDNISLQDAQSIQKTTPQLLKINIPQSNCPTVDPRNDVTPFTDIRVRKAMQMAIDLPTIAKTYYGGTAEPYPSSLTSRYYFQGWGFPYEKWPQDLKDEYAYNPTAAKQLLAAAGYPNGFKTDVVAQTSGDMDLLQIVKSYFANVGIDMEIRPMEPTAWTTFVITGRKQDQLVYRFSGFVGATYEPTRQLQKFWSQSASDYINVNDPVFDAFYTKAMASNVTVDTIKKLLVDANEYAARQHYVVSLIIPMQYAFYWPWLKGYAGQWGSISGGASSPSILKYYLERFWIDQNLKHSMGY